MRFLTAFGMTCFTLIKGEGKSAASPHFFPLFSPAVCRHFERSEKSVIYTGGTVIGERSEKSVFLIPLVQLLENVVRNLF